MFGWAIIVSNCHWECHKKRCKNEKLSTNKSIQDMTNMRNCNLVERRVVFGFKVHDSAPRGVKALPSLQLLLQLKGRR